MALPNLLIIFSWLAFVLYWGVSAIGVKKDVAQKGSWWWSGRSYLLRLAAVVIIVIVAVLRGGIFHRFGLISGLSNPSFGPVLANVGAVLCVLGISLAIWARWNLGTNWSSRPSLKVGHELVTSGPYQLLRHPIYTGILAAALGSALAVSWLWLGAFLVACVIFVRRVATEESLMLQKFPDSYQLYVKKTWALIPFVY
jgi:protein-S-isoprenylcysteine O-methyltransferase Ste14